MRVHRRISKGFDVFEYYTNNQWDFKSDIAQTVRRKLNTRERRDYKVDAIGKNPCSLFPFKQSSSFRHISYDLFQKGFPFSPFSRKLIMAKESGFDDAGDT